jgi:poly(A) polymerase
VRDAGDELVRLHKLTRADCTTRNQRRAMMLAATYDELEDRIAKLQEQEELNSIRPDLDGEEIMAALSLKPGPQVGKAYNHMLNLRLDKGPMSKEQALAELKNWWNSQN